MAASETKRNQGSDELPWLSNYAPWKECFYDKVRQRCRSLQEKKVQMIRAQKGEEEKVKKREPCDWLAKEWLSDEKQSLDNRIYLLDKLLPTVIAGMEKLLMEVERKGVLVPDKEPTQFNPINFLGEYLMRHNPQHGASPKPGPYLRAMKMVTEELKSEMPGTTSERLARMKAGAKNRREDREKVNTMKSQVKEMRKAALAIQFKEWTVDVGGRIPVALVQRALRSFPGVIASTPVDVRRASCDRKLEVVDTLEKNINVDEFTEYVHSYTEQFSDDTFEEVLKHLCQCVDDFQEARKHDVRRQMFAELFLDCDYGKVGLLDRRKILALLTDFYDRSPVMAKRGLSNPRQWPIIELQEIELVDLWGGLDQEVSEELSEQLVLAQTGISEGEILALDPADENRQGTSRMRDREGLFEPRGMSEAEMGGIPKEENQAAASSDTELRKEGEEVAAAMQSPSFEGSGLDGDTIHREKSSCHEDTKTERESESAGADRQEEAFPGPASTGCRLSKEGEPVAEAVEETPARRESSSRHHGSQFGQETSSETGLEDEDLLQTQGKGDLLTGDQGCRYGSYGVSVPEDWKCENSRFPDLRPIMAAIQNRWASRARSAFDESCLNLPQFVQLMETFVGENISLPTLKRLVAFLKEEYKQTEEEKMEQLEKVHRISRLAQRKLLLEALFEKWDNNASGFLDLEEVDAVLSTFKEGMEKEALRKAHLRQLMGWGAHRNAAVNCLQAAQPQKNLADYSSLVFQACQNALQKYGWTQALHEGLTNQRTNTQEDSVAKSIPATSNITVSSSFDPISQRHRGPSRFGERLSSVGKLSPRAFQTFLEFIASEFSGDEDEAVDNLVEFLTASVERSHVESLRSFTRREWLHNIQQAAETSGASMEPVYKAMFKALSQDAEVHGGNKKISAYIALLEENQLSPERGPNHLRYVACTADDAPYVLNQILYRDMKGVSFAAVEEGKPIHVPRVQLHGNIHFWNCDRPEEERMGSLLVLPLHDARWRAFGVLGLDTLRDPCEQTIFLSHEISFYQGVSHAFSKAYHHICTLEDVLQMAVTALDWLYPRAPGVHAVVMYLVEPDKDKTWDYALRKMMTTDNTGQKEIHISPVLLLRKETLLRDYLFKSTDTSEAVRASVHGEYHIAVPLRDLSGQALGVFDISIGHHQKLPPHEHKDLQKMLKTAQAACSEILKLSLEETQPAYVLEAEHSRNLRRAGILFYRCMLQDLRECLQKLGAESFAELKSCVEPPALVHNIVKAALLLLHPDWKGSEKTEDWSQCKLKLDNSLIQEICCFDPTAASVQVQAELLLDGITGVPRAAVWQHRSAPAGYLFHWVHACLSLAEMASSPRWKTPQL